MSIRSLGVELTWTPGCDCGWQCWSPWSSGGGENHWGWGGQPGPHSGRDWGESSGRGSGQTAGICGLTRRVRQSRRRSGRHGESPGEEEELVIYLEVGRPRGPVIPLSLTLNKTFRSRAYSELATVSSGRFGLGGQNGSCVQKYNK